MRKLWILAVLALGCNSQQEEDLFEPQIIAEATLFALENAGDNQYTVMEKEIGSAAFEQDGEVVRLTIELSGMTPNTYKAVHIHDGSVESPGRHWNRGSFFAACDSLSLGNFWGKPFVGDVGNVRIDETGSGLFTLRTDLWSINSGDNSDLVGRPIIIHDLPQDFAEECNPNHDHNHLHNNPKIGGGTVILISEEPVKSTASGARVAAEDVPDFLICN